MTFRRQFAHLFISDTSGNCMLYRTIKKYLRILIKIFNKTSQFALNLFVIESSLSIVKANRCIDAKLDHII